MAEGEGKADDPFTRRKCQPTLVTLVRSWGDWGLDRVYVCGTLSMALLRT